MVENVGETLFWQFIIGNANVPPQHGLSAAFLIWGELVTTYCKNIPKNGISLNNLGDIVLW